MNVVAAVIQRDGQILICQRKTGRHALKWEFPGGKVEPGEDSQTALARELREELNIEAQIGPLMHAETFEAFHLEFYQVTAFSGEPENLQFEKMLWESPKNLPAYDFLDGDIAFVRKLASGC